MAAVLPFLPFPPNRQSTLEPGARLKTEYLLQVKFYDQFIHRRLAMLPLHFGQDQLGGIGVVETAKVGLDFEKLSCPIKRHVLRG